MGRERESRKLWAGRESELLPFHHGVGANEGKSEREQGINVCERER